MQMAVLKHCPGLEKAYGKSALFQHVLWKDGFRLLLPDVSATYKALRSCWLATWRALPRDLCCSEAIHLPHLPSAQAKLVIMRLKYCNKEDFFPQHFPSAFISLGRQWCDFQTCAQA